MGLILSASRVPFLQPPSPSASPRKLHTANDTPMRLADFGVSHKTKAQCRWPLVALVALVAWFGTNVEKRSNRSTALAALSILLDPFRAQWFFSLENRSVIFRWFSEGISRHLPPDQPHQVPLLRWFNEWDPSDGFLCLLAPMVGNSHWRTCWDRAKIWDFQHKKSPPGLVHYHPAAPAAPHQQLTSCRWHIVDILNKQGLEMAWNS